VQKLNVKILWNPKRKIKFPVQQLRKAANILTQNYFSNINYWVKDFNQLAKMVMKIPDIFDNHMQL
jgi:hypothetical protein